jgi:hypothetical protein
VEFSASASITASNVNRVVLAAHRRPPDSCSRRLRLLAVRRLATRGMYVRVRVFVCVCVCVWCLIATGSPFPLRTLLF